ncbi:MULTISPECIES: hypothetical protein [Shewanella]|uniref:Uncharacterized protein n=2 Tax=Shewanella TaxID=22 RepID=A0ABU3G160_9GAMM|nr:MULTISPECIES: hypothetical protein [Shewanella]MDT3280679.1 hypothetical protein [Shewanella sp. SP2S1-2]SUI61300.1 Uncharacterised protein [Shewanella baltica]
MSQSPFIRVYQRKSKSPWDDHSTVLLLADIDENDNDPRALQFTRYIYLHRDIKGQHLGISISKSLLEEHAEFDTQYLMGLEMMMLLLMYKDDISAFCELFTAEFQQIFGLPPILYFDAAEQFWAEQIIEAEA